MKHNFKPGDKARMAVDAINLTGVLFRKGQVVTVVENDQSDVPYRVENEDGDKKWLRADHLEPIDTPEFQVGDTVYDPVLFPGPDPDVPNPGEVVDVQNGCYSVVVKFGIKKTLYSQYGGYFDSSQPTLSKTPYRFVREEIKWQPKNGEGVLYNTFGALCAGVFTNMVDDKYRVAVDDSSFVVATVYPFDPELVGKPVNDK